MIPPFQSRARLAERVSAATRLPLLAVPLFVVVGISASDFSGLLWAGLCVFLTSGLSLAYLLYLTRSGKVGDPRRISQGERVGPLRVVAVIHAGAFVVVALLDAPAALQATLLAYAIATVLFALVSPVLNLSLHTAGAAGAAVCLAFVLGAWGMVAFILLPPVWWARITLGRHTPLELLLGALAGGGGTWAAFQLAG